MMCVPISSPRYIYRENMSVIHNISKKDLIIKKTTCHTVRESVVMRKSFTGHIRLGDNPASLLTKVITG